MKLIIGLGNPGPKYAKTRHNIGFVLIDQLREEWSLDPFSENKKFHGWMTQGIIHGEKIILLKPITYMNRSGQSVVAVASYYDIAPEDILVIHDEIDFPTAKIAYKQGGSHAGHNGLRDIIQKLGTRDFWRIRVGVNRPTDKSLITDYVLGSFTPAQKKATQQQRDLIYQYCLSFIAEDLHKKFAK